MLKNNIVFITHHNNDFDHFLPLIVHFKKDKEIRVKNLAFYHKYLLLQNKLHKYICQKQDVELDSITDLFYFNFLNNAIVKIHNYVLENMVPSKRTTTTSKNAKLIFLDLVKSPGNTFLRFFNYLIERYLVISSIFLLTKKKMEEYVEENKIDFAIIDVRGYDESHIDINPIQRFILLVKQRKKGSMNNLLFRFTKICRDKNIPIFMMLHGPYPIFWEFSNKDRITYKNIFKPDYLAISNKKNLDVYKKVAGKKDTFYIGDPRYDLDWINYLESCSLKVYKDQIEKPKHKTVLLYLMDILKIDRENIEKNNQYKFELHKDILSMVNEFDNLQIWVKHHPRNPYKIPIQDFINKEKQGNIKQFGNDVDTNILLALSDIRLATSSTTLINPLIQKRPAILYDRWKEKLDSITIYDSLKYNASSKEELKKQIQKILDNGYKIDDNYLKSFYKDVFSILSPSISMTELYANKIRELIG